MPRLSLWWSGVTLVAVVYLLACAVQPRPATPPSPADSAMVAVVTGPNAATLYLCAVPPIPQVVSAAGGPVPVHRVPVVVIEGVDTTRQTVLGAFDYSHRLIEIRQSLVGLAAWQTLEHERVHVALFDAGATLADDAVEDRIADAIANQRVNDLVLAAELAGHCHARQP